MDDRGRIGILLSPLVGQPYRQQAGRLAGWPASRPTGKTCSSGLLEDESTFTYFPQFEDISGTSKKDNSCRKPATVAAVVTRRWWRQAAAAWRAGGENIWDLACQL